MRALTVFSYAYLVSFWHKGLRNGNWHRLGVMERIFFRAATYYAKMGRIIVNDRIVTLLSGVVEKLKTAIRKGIVNAGMNRAKEVLSAFELNGVFEWAPQVRSWLMDTSYVLWLGLSSQLPHDNWK